ncbi:MULTISPECIES: rhomboid family intramembrane serine protease [unclassified Apibacter]|uniref:rhomboid family intramembrane serine protease n=1 Tax=unclassified Apibacter TaxID=2630820 RepID=UPI001322245E|nr:MULTISPECIES: rhomboid family intramembrane serine protease [unclassified Apibacter]MCX8677277.1 rhomboid family intramembrane serine protease [Apibacter sp. B3919]MXO25595.1 rhomboid family intramembrane serine protease [Apibacter sp. B3924]MXO26750.1 rhomboid family intramembrane serine protease [Apibacter sp. B3813]MXO28680.1 rhomboid family intramembrane serine protease [Apibacter sp. B3913]MXO30634.1 rhomboid family intramembrane serine protease [Apibacter sp. B3912]
MHKFPIHREAIIVPIVLVGAIWLVFLLQNLLVFKECYGIIPLKLKGLRGVLLAPLFHGNLTHILSNTIPLFVLTFFTFQFYEKLAYFVLLNGWIISGFVVWLLPNFSLLNSSVLSCHIGASGIIYVLASFLFFSGIFRHEKTLLAVSLIVVFLYGSLVWGIFPRELLGIYDDRPISWESHLSGAVTGFILAYMLRRIGKKREKPQWDKDEYDHSDDEKLWQEYQLEYPEYFHEEDPSKYDSTSEINKTDNVHYEDEKDSLKNQEKL